MMIDKTKEKKIVHQYERETEESVGAAVVGYNQAEPLFCEI